MTSEEIAAITRSLGTVVKEALITRDAKIAALEQRLEVLEAKPKGLEYRGVWEATRSYQRNDVATVGGSMWVCLVANNGMRPGKSPGAWQLAVQRGRDGRDADGRRRADCEDE